MFYSQNNHLNKWQTKILKEKYSTQVGEKENRNSNMDIKEEIKPKIIKWDKESFHR